jgi:hypothetical protein
VWKVDEVTQTKVPVEEVLFLAVSRSPEPGARLLTMATKSSFLTSESNIRNAEAAVTYFGRELGTSDYYLAQKGLWYGWGTRLASWITRRLKLKPSIMRSNSTRRFGKGR